MTELERINTNVVALHDMMFNPGKKVEFQHVIADIYRLDDDGKIVEHWDVLQIAPDLAPNRNGLL